MAHKTSKDQVITSSSEKLRKQPNRLFKNNSRYIVDCIILLIAFALAYTLFVGINTKKDIETILNENKKLELKVDSLKTDNELITNKIFALEETQIIFYDKINENNSLINNNNNELQKIKKIYHENIISINSYNISQLDSFFTERYKIYYR